MRTTEEISLLSATEKQSKLKTQKTAAQIVGGLGAVGVALQNYPAVSLFVTGIARGFTSMSRLLTWSIEIGSFMTGAMCSGLVNFWMNVELLEGFFKRIFSDKDYQYKRLKLSNLQKLQYFGGIFVFVVTGGLFGLMAFTFAMTGPLAILSIAAGVFVAAIMTIQEVETWLGSYENNDIETEKKLSKQQWLGKSIGHLIAIGNVLALSLLFTLSLSEFLCALHVTAFPALVAGGLVAFTFGAFTEYYFYNFYLANFCKDFKENWNKMLASSQAWLGLTCVSVNAFVNAALTYAGVLLLTDLLVAASLALPPMGVMVALSAASAIFAGSASFVLGLDFWTRQNPAKKEVPVAVVKKPSFMSSGLNFFAKSLAIAETDVSLECPHLS